MLQCKRLSSRSCAAGNARKFCYRPMMLNNFRVIFTDIPSAEMIKYAANSMLATCISFMDDIANLCELVGADVNMVRKGIGSDTRIGSKFLYPGCGYGESCFPKDVKALIKTAEKNGYKMGVLKAVEEVNEYQKTVLFKKLAARFGGVGNLRGKTIAMWGLAFKPETDDMREATALVLIDLLVKAGAVVRMYDPVAMNECKRRMAARYVAVNVSGNAANPGNVIASGAKQSIASQIVYCNDMYEALLDADALLLVTEWKQFRMPSFGVMKKSMKNALIIDGRNIYDPKELAEAGFEYSAIRC